MSPDRQGRGIQAAGLEACPIDAVLLQQTICWQLRRSRPREILDVLQGIRLRFLGTCSRACANSLFASQRRITRIGSKLGSFMSACAAIAHPLLLSVKRRS